MFKHIKIVLVGTLYDRNIGSISRVLSNMGLSDLILINHRCKISFEAQLAAATGQAALNSRIEYSSWNEFLDNEPRGLLVAFSARDGRGRLTEEFQTTLERVKKSIQDDDKNEIWSEKIIYLIFGPEDCGLSSDDLKYANSCVRLPVFGNNPSYNLSHAVLAALLLLRTNINFISSNNVILNESIRSEQNQPEDPLRVQLLEPILEEWLLTLGLNLDRHKINALTVIQRMILRSMPTKKEFQMLETMLQQTIRKLKSKD